MSKPFAYWIRLALVTSLCSFTTFSPVLAGRLIERLIQRGQNGCNISCELVVPPCSPVPTCEVIECDPCAVVETACPCEAAPETSLPPIVPADQAASPKATEQANPAQVSPEATVEEQKPAPVSPAPVAPPTETKPEVATPAVPAPPPAVPVETTPVEPKPVDATPIAPALPPVVAPEPAITAPAPAPVYTEPAAPATSPSTINPPAPVVEPAVTPEVEVLDTAIDPFAEPTDPIVTEEPKTSAEGEDTDSTDLFGEPATDNVGAPETTDAGLDDLFDEPEAANPLDEDILDDAVEDIDPNAESVDDLFGSGEADDAAPVEAEMTDEPAIDDAIEATVEEDADATDVDDLFGDESTPTTANPEVEAEIEAEVPEDASADDAFSDLFDDENDEVAAPAETDLDDVLNQDDAVDIFAPAEADDEDTLDLFGEEPSQEAAPIEEPADDADLEDVFGEKPAAQDNAPGVDDQNSDDATLQELFNNNDDSTAPTPDIDDAFEGLFDTPSDSSTSIRNSDRPLAEANIEHDSTAGKPVSTDDASNTLEKFNNQFDHLPSAVDQDAPVDASNGDAEVQAPASEDLETLFGISQFQAPEKFTGAEFKTWVDNTGTYQVKARLAMIYSDKIKLVKESGKTTTVPLNRLSDRDFSYVQWVASSLMNTNNGTKLVKHETVAEENESLR